MIIASLKKSSLYLYGCFFLSLFFVNDGSVSDVTACIKAGMEQLIIAINEAKPL
jgi:hypothetical protein